MKRRPRKGINNPDPYRNKFFLLFGGIFAAFLLGLLVIVGKYLFITYVNNDSTIENPVVLAAQTESYETLFAQSGIELERIETLEGGNVISVTVVDGPDVLLSGSSNRAQQVDLLKQILIRLAIDNKKASSIDLRFSKPIVKF